MSLKRFFAGALSVIMAVSFAACGTDLSSSKEESRIVMTVDGWEVPYEMYRYAALINLSAQTSEIYASIKNSAESVPADSSAAATEEPTDGEKISMALAEMSDDEKATLAKEAEVNAIDTVVDVYSLFTAAKDEGIEPFGEMINQLTDMKMEEIRATYGDDAEYLEAVKAYFMNDSVYSVLTRHEIVSEQLYEKYVKDGRIDTSAEAAIAGMKSDNAVRVKQILVSFKNHSEDEALRIAEEIYDEVGLHVSEDGIVDEAAFDELKETRGEDLEMFNNPDGYYIYKGYADRYFEEAAFALEIGHVSGIVRTSEGYSILMRAEKEDSYIESEKRLDKIKSIYVDGVYSSILDEYAASAKVEKTAEFAGIDILTMK